MLPICPHFLIAYIYHKITLLNIFLKTHNSMSKLSHLLDRLLHNIHNKYILSYLYHILLFFLNYLVGALFLLLLLRLGMLLDIIYMRCIFLHLMDIFLMHVHLWNSMILGFFHMDNLWSIQVLLLLISLCIYLNKIFLETIEILIIHSKYHFQLGLHYNLILYCLDGMFIIYLLILFRNTFLYILIMDNLHYLNVLDFLYNLLLFHHMFLLLLWSIF